MLNDLMKTFSGYRTYAAAAGLVVMAVIQFKAGDLFGASQSALGALAAFGLRSAIGDRLAEVLKQVAAARKTDEVRQQQNSVPPT